ncbi:DNA-directed RNA polymerase subunit beta [Ornithinibacillus salinisoli]|uniref:DNA-directed RNA polymerase subunit beta n=1 Tax=Ornithinibacillus salinisoli TaxID=1848459 RepID=A0ABW4VXS8_9BACI
MLTTNQSKQNTNQKQTRRQHKEDYNSAERKQKRSRSYEEELTETDKKTRKEQKKKQKAEKRKNKSRRRVFPIWLRIIVVLLLAGAALIGGLMFGYGIIGDGDPSDALKSETWQHILDLVKKE